MTSDDEPATPDFAKAAMAIYEVAPSRLAFGRYTIAHEKHVGEGDIRASYSADTIALQGRIRKPFVFRSGLWVCVSNCGETGLSARAYRCEAMSEFNGAATTYGVKTQDSEAARSDPNGFYHGMTVGRGGKQFVLVGPPAEFQPGATEQPGLFSMH